MLTRTDLRRRLPGQETTLLLVHDEETGQKLEFKFYVYGFRDNVGSTQAFWITRSSGLVDSYPTLEIAFDNW